MLQNYQRLQEILLRIHQYRVRIIYKARPDLFIADWLSKQNQGKEKDEENIGHAISYQHNTDSYQHTRKYDNP